MGQHRDEMEADLTFTESAVLDAIERCRTAAQPREPSARRRTPAIALLLSVTGLNGQDG